MQKLVSFALFGIVVALVTVTLAEKRTLPLRTLFNQASKICMQKLADEQQERLGHNELDDLTAEDTRRCYNACVWKTTGLFANNTFDLENMNPTAVEIRHRVSRVFTRTIIYTCVGHGYEITDECEKANTFMNCYRTLVQQRALGIQK